VPVPDRRERAAMTRRKRGETSERRAFFGGMGRAMFRGMRTDNMLTVTVRPAYGRDYRNKQQALSAWIEGKDFIYASYGPYCGQYCSIRDFTSYEVTIYYNHLQNCTIWNGEKN